MAEPLEPIRDGTIAALALFWSGHSSLARGSHSKYTVMYVPLYR